METKKAIEWLKAISATQNDSPHKNSLVDRKEALHLAITALEKQMPKKPVKDEYYHECCPNCGWVVCYNEWGGRYLPHCENCGQAIDWK